MFCSSLNTRNLLQIVWANQRDSLDKIPSFNQKKYDFYHDTSLNQAFVSSNLIFPLHYTFLLISKDFSDAVLWEERKKKSKINRWTGLLMSPLQPGCLSTT